MKYPFISQEMSISPTVLFHCLASSGLVTEELWVLQLVSREYRDLYNRYVIYKTPSMRAIQEHWGLMGAERLDRLRSLTLLRKTNSKTRVDMIVPFLQERLLDGLPDLIQTGVFCRLDDEQFRQLCRAYDIRPTVFIMCLHAIHQRYYVEYELSHIWEPTEDKCRLKSHMRRANLYFQILGRIPLYLRHLAMIALWQQGHRLTEDTTRVLRLSLLRPSRRRRAYVTVLAYAETWYHRELAEAREQRNRSWGTWVLHYLGRPESEF